MRPETDGANASAVACSLLPMPRMRAVSLNVEGCKCTKSGPIAMQKRSICMQHSSSASWNQAGSKLEPHWNQAGTKCNRPGTKLAQPPQHTTPEADAVCEYVKCPSKL